MSPLLARPGLAAVALLLAAPSLCAQQEEPVSAEPDLPEPGEHDDAPHAFEFALSGDGLWFAYRSGLHRGKGYTSLGFFVSQDDDFVLHGKWMRFGEPRADVPLGVGVGLGVLGAEVDETSDEVLALTLTGAADYALDRLLGLTYPTRLGVEVSWAPDVATFADGDRVLDVLGRVEIDLSTWATVFAGYRRLEIDLKDAGDVELDRALQAGVRLGF